MGDLFLIGIAFAYVVSSIPFGVIFSKIFSAPDPTSIGSGNIGATNVFRSNKIAGVLTLICDVAKGYFVLFICEKICHFDNQGILCVGIIAVIGHIFPVHFVMRCLWIRKDRLQSGKGVATFFGVAIYLSPIAALIGLLSWILVLLITRYSSVASMISLVVFSVAFFMKNPDAYQCKYLAAFCIAMPILIFFSHRENISRLIRKKELKIGKK